MTRNVYQGVDAELSWAVAARSFNEFLLATSAIFNGYYERNFPEQAAGLAAEIEETQPDVIGLQEFVMVRKDTPADGPATLANEVSLDYLQILLDELQARGLHYAPVVQSINWGVEVPTALGFDFRHTDRVVTLIRTDEGSGMAVLGKNSGHFETNCALPTTAAGRIEIVRGWTCEARSTQPPELRFRALLTEGGTRLILDRERLDLVEPRSRDCARSAYLRSHEQPLRSD